MRPLYTLLSKIGTKFFRVKRYDEPNFLVKQIQSGNVKKILLIQLQQLGDNLVFTPTVRQIVERLGHLQIDMLVNSVGYDVYKNFPRIDRFYVDKTWYWGKGERKLLPLFKLLWQIRKQKYDLAILDTSCVALKYPVIAFLTGARYRLGVDQNDRGFLNNVIYPYNTSQSFVYQNFDLLPYLGLNKPDPSLWLPTTDADKQAAQRLMRSIRGERSSRVIVIHQGSNWESKKWFFENWVALCQKFLLFPDVKLVFSGAAREREQVNCIVASLRSPDRVFSLVGQTSIHSLKAFIELSDLFITIDSGPMHIGNATSAPMVVLMSGIDYENRWIEPCERVKVLRKDVACKYCLSEFCPTGTKECMKLITVEEVYQAALSFLPELASAN